MTLDHFVLTEDDASTIADVSLKLNFGRDITSWVELYKNDDDRKFCHSCPRQNGHKIIVQKIKECSCTKLADKLIVEAQWVLITKKFDWSQVGRAGIGSAWPRWGPAKFKPRPGPCLWRSGPGLGFGIHNGPEPEPNWF